MAKKPGSNFLPHNVGGIKKTTQARYRLPATAAFSWFLALARKKKLNVSSFKDQGIAYKKLGFSRQQALQIEIDRITILYRNTHSREWIQAVAKNNIARAYGK